jgi:AcrR family transcriptional regulator
MIFSNVRHGEGSRRSESFSQGERTRQTILARAMKIAAREGLAALTIGRLARELRLSKSGLISHFGSKQLLELATLETARKVFTDAVIRPASARKGGIERVWNLCDLWLQHIERHVFSGSYFFTGAFLEHVGQRGPIAEVVSGIAQEWFNALRKSVEEGQKKGEINPKAAPKQIAWELNGLLVGAHWAYLLKHDDCWRESRAALLSQLRKLATGEIPTDAFTSERNWKKYLEGKS